MSLLKDLDLIQQMQSNALSIADDFRQALEKVPLLTPRVGQDLIEKLVAGKREATSSYTSIYQSLATEIAKAIVLWKNDKQQSLPSIVTTWLGYDSKLNGGKWWETLRVYPENLQGKIEAYHSRVSDGQAEQSWRATGPVELWFRHLLSESDSPAPGPPSMHKYLSAYKPRSKGDNTLITAVTFYTRNSNFMGLGHSDDSVDDERISQEASLIARAEQPDHIFVNLDQGSGSLARLLNESLVQAVDLAAETELNSVEGGRRWSAWYGFYLRHVLMRTPQRRMHGETEVTGPDIPPEVVVQLGAKVARAESQLPSQVIHWFYSSMTNLRIYVPSTHTDLGSVIIFSDRVVDWELSRLIAAAVWPVFSHLRQIEESVIATANLKRHALRSAVSAIMARNMSHNIGSHPLDYFLSDVQSSRTYRDADIAFLRYIKERMDFLAEITTHWRELPWLEPSIS